MAAIPNTNRNGATIECSVHAASASGSWKQRGDDFKASAGDHAEINAYLASHKLAQGRPWKLMINEFPCDQCHAYFRRVTATSNVRIVVQVNRAAESEGYRRFHATIGQDPLPLHIVYRTGLAWYVSGEAGYMTEQAIDGAVGVQEIEQSTPASEVASSSNATSSKALKKKKPEVKPRHK